MAGDITATLLLAVMLKVLTFAPFAIAKIFLFGTLTFLASKVALLISTILGVRSLMSSGAFANLPFPIFKMMNQPNIDPAGMLLLNGMDSNAQNKGMMKNAGSVTSADMSSNMMAIPIMTGGMPRMIATTKASLKQGSGSFVSAEASSSTQTPYFMNVMSSLQNPLPSDSSSNSGTRTSDLAFRGYNLAHKNAIPVSSDKFYVDRNKAVPELTTMNYIQYDENSPSYNTMPSPRLQENQISIQTNLDENKVHSVLNEGIAFGTSPYSSVAYNSAKSVVESNENTSSDMQNSSATYSYAYNRAALPLNFNFSSEYNDHNEINR